MQPQYPGRELETLAALERYQRYIVELFGADLRGRAIELGAGRGNLARVWRPRTSSAVLVEPDAALCRQLRSEFADDRNAAVLEGTLDDVSRSSPADVADASFDCAITVNVLEHILDDAGTMRRLAALVRPGGAVLTFVPALPVLFGTLDEAVGHHRRYLAPQLRRLHEQAGLRIERQQFVDVLGVVPWWVAGRVLRRRTFDGILVRIYDRFGVPITRVLDRLHPPLGKGLVCVARRPSP